MHTNPRTCPLSAFFEQYFLPLCLRGRSPRTLALYRISLRSFAKFLTRAPVLADLCDDTVNRYLCHYRALPRSPATTNKERANLLALWRFAARKGYLPSWPDVPKETQPEQVPVAWLPEELKRLFAAAATAPGWIEGAKASAWWTALLLLCWDTGERISALLAVRWESIDLDRGWVIVPAGSRKGGRSDEAYRLHPDTLRALAVLHPDEGTGAVFRWPYDRSYIWSRFGKLLKAAGLPSDRKSKFHRIRRSVGSYVKAAGGDPSEALRHRDSRVTRAYLDPRLCGERQAVDWLFRPDT